MINQYQLFDTAEPEPFQQDLFDDGQDTIAASEIIGEQMAEIDALNVQVNSLLSSLIWCGTHKDFSPGGVAHAAWNSVIQPTINEVLLSRMP